MNRVWKRRSEVQMDSDNGEGGKRVVRAGTHNHFTPQ